MFRLALIMVAVFGLVGCGKAVKTEEELKSLNVADYPNVDNTVYGAWHFDTPSKDANGVTYTFNLYLNLKNQIGYETICEHFPDTLSASLAFTGKITTTQVVIEKTHTVMQKGDGSVKECQLNVNPATLDFQVRDDKLFLYDKATTLSYTRIR